MIQDIKELNIPPYATLSNATVQLNDMGTKTISTKIKIDGDVVPDFSSNWELEFRGEKYIYALREPQASKDNTSIKANYDLLFEHYAIYIMKRKYFVKLSVPADIGSSQSIPPIVEQYQASINLNLANFVKYFSDNLRFHYGDTITIDLNPDWIYAEEETFVSISYSYIWDILQQLYELYNVRWIIESNGQDKYVIKVGYPAVEISHIFEYGYEGGLLTFERQIQNSNIKNILLGRGGEKNIPYRYFKAIDPENPEFDADPDAIPELATTYFTELRPKTFRDYVQGWRAKHYGGSYEPNRGYAYEQGYTDETFEPVEYVKDDNSINKYGECWGGLDSNETIYPTIQGITIDGLGRVDEVVAVEKVTTDDVEESVTNDSVSSNLPSFGKTIKIKGNSGTGKLFMMSPTFALDGDKKHSLIGAIYNIKGISDGYLEIAWEVIPTGEKIDTTNLLIKTNDKLEVVNVLDGSIVNASNIPNGMYYLRYSADIKNTYPHNSLSDVTVTVDGLKTISSSPEDEGWKPTFDVWIKNIWDTSKSGSESDLQYTSRVWDKIAGEEDMMVSFSKGFLSIADYDFKVVKGRIAYDNSKSLNGVNSEWRLSLEKSDAEAEATGQYIPNTNVNAIAGDTFFFTGIDMPHQYVLWAESKIDDWKRDALLETAKSNPTWVLKFDKVRAVELVEQSKQMIDMLTAGIKLRSYDKRFVFDAAYLDLYAQSVTIKWNEGAIGIIPDIECVLTDKVLPVINPVTQLSGDVESLKNMFIGLSNIEQVVRAVGDKIYLRKDGMADRSLSPTQFAGTVTGNKWRQGAIGGNDWGIYRDDQGNSIFEADRVIVRKDLQVNNFIVNQITAQGGKQIESAAVIECTRVDDTPSGYVCYFDQKQGSISNLFKVDDVAYSQVFDADNTTISQYKRMVVSIDVNSITLSKAIANGDGIPNIGDVIIHYGNYTDPERQYVIVRDVIGGGYERMLSGLNSVNANGDEYYFAGRQTGQGIRWFVGDKNNNIEYKDKELNIKAKVTFTSGSSGLGNLEEWADAEADINNAQGTANEAKQQIQATNEYVELLKSDVNSEILAVNKRLDGVIVSYFEIYDPSPTNYPANEWVTDKDKEDHVGDTFTNKKTGNSWKWKIINSVWKWDEITDTLEKELLKKIATAQDTADSKRRNFVFTPYPPYDVGDTWSQGSEGDYMRCIVSRASGAFVASDWDKASKYTDDTKANDAADKANAAQAKADALKYLSNALPIGQTVTVDNGVVLAGVMAVANSNGVVVAGMAGVNFIKNGDFGYPKCPMIWAGADSLPLVNKAKTRIYPDGTIETSALAATEGCKIGDFMLTSQDTQGAFFPGIWYKEGGSSAGSSDLFAFWSKGRMTFHGQSTYGSMDVTINVAKPAHSLYPMDPQDRSPSLNVSSSANSTSGINIDSYNGPAITISNGYISGFRLRERVVSTSTTLTKYDNIITCANSAAIILNLPLDPQSGQVYEIYRVADPSITINGNGKLIRRLQSTEANSHVFQGPYLNGVIRLVFIAGENKWMMTFSNGLAA